MKTAIFELQVAIFNALENNEELKKRVKGVFDSVDKNTPFPYIYLGEDEATRVETKDFCFEKIKTPIEVYSDASNKKEVKEILKLILQALENINLGQGFEITKKDFNNIEIIELKDGIKLGTIELDYEIEEE